MSDYIDSLNLTVCQIYDLKEAARRITHEKPTQAPIDLRDLYDARLMVESPEPLKPSLKRYFKSIRIGYHFYQ